MSESNSLVLEAVDADYGRGLVLHSVSLVTSPGAAIAILGANGAGKTTLVRVITGILRPKAGRVLFEGRDVTDLKVSAHARLGIVMVPEGRMVFPDLTVQENLALGAMGAGVPKKRMGEERVYSIFPELEKLRRRRTGMLSGGEQQMVAIGRAIVANPKLMILDEPSLGLAPLLVERMYEALATLMTESTISLLVIEQNTSIALGFCRRSYVLRNGSVVAEGDAASLGNPEVLARLYLG